MKYVLTSRDAALEALYRVEVRSSYADLALEGILKGSDLDPRDRRLATELTFGCIRWRKRIDYILSKFLKGEVARLDPYTRNILRLGAYQVFFLDRIPDYAAISEAVKQSKKFGSKGCSSLVNGVLRSMAERSSDIVFPDGKHQPVEHISTFYSHPRWLVDRWVKRYGVEETQRLCEANNSIPPLSIRANLLKTTREELSEKLQQENVSSQPGRLSSSSLSIVIRDDLASLEGYRKGLFQVQDESSVLVSDILEPRPGETIVDLCSGPGGKTTHIAELMEDEGLVIAVDIRRSRLKFVLDNAGRLGLNIIVGVVADGQFFGARSADRILVDAPCSGLGVLRRRADLRWRMSEKEIVNLSRLQLALLLSAADSVRAGGILVYSTCTIEPEENELVVSRFLELRGDYRLEDAGGFVASSLVDEEGYYRTLPHKQGLDGAFAARLVKAGK
ncbi:16S rRNA (cytosine(967)-C(5))-methyltransferase RsmB [candidate division TA06 bacterium]|uniref:16S rRNA (cytosine(967)-C(5))-methyltransferase n=1 Tax=candidate division TA06 bacterium TaxID=2250710 RepID=A0A523UT04_UNCT6|nr:MAG: 16S rRNA (cytosine(967)-C(5))-methyltransferase RsmB [candidate division TA06 bacterium]